MHLECQLPKQGTWEAFKVDFMKGKWTKSMSGSILICMTNPACSVLVGRAGLACHSRRLSLWYEHFWQSVMLIVLRIVLLGERKGKAFLFLYLFHLQERRGIWGNKKCFQSGFDFFFFNNPVRTSTTFSILNLIVTHSVVLSGKY